MSLLSCFLRKAGDADVQKPCQKCKEVVKACKGASPVSTVDGRFMDLLHAFASLEGGGLPVISDACAAVCEHMDAAHACVCMLGVDQSATVVACAGIDGELALGRRMGMGLLDAGCQSTSVVGAALHMYETSPAMPIAYHEVSGSTVRADDSTQGYPSSYKNGSVQPAAAGVFGKGGNGSPLTVLPRELQDLAAEHQLTQFAAAVLVTSGMPIGILTLAAKGPSRPACWTPEAIQSVAVVLAGHLRQLGQQQQLADALAGLYSATTISDVVEAVGEAAVEVATAVAHVRGQARVAFLSADATAAAIFQQSPAPQQTSDGLVSAHNGLPSPLVARNFRRPSCEYVMPSAVSSGSRKAVKSRKSMDAAAMATVARIASITAAEANARPNSVIDMSHLSGRRSRPAARMSFTMPSTGKGPSCKGHTLPLSGTLLAEALSMDASGLCISDCASYVQDKKAFPRDTVLSRDGVMPLALALATFNDQNSKPLLALYLTYNCTLPQPLLQAVVQELQQLLQAILPIIKSKLSGSLKIEWKYLCAQLEEGLRGKTVPGDSANATQVGGGGNGSDSEQQVSLNSVAAAEGHPGAPHGPSSPGPPGATSGQSETSFSFQEPAMKGDRRPSGGGGRGETSGASGSPFTAAAAAAVSGGGGGRAHSGVRQRNMLLGATRSEGPNVRPNSNLRKILGMLPSEGDDASSGVGRLQRPMSGTPAPAADSVGGGIGGGSIRGSGPGTMLEVISGEGVSGEDEYSGEGKVGQLQSQVPNKRLVRAVTEVSFKLEAARSPRGASRLAPIITIMHERLKAAQAAQMTGSRTEARTADLQSVKLLQEIGKGGYGTVYRGTYHGAEVAVKVIQEKELAALQTISGDVHSAKPSSVLLHKQNIHDAIELVASVSVSHPNIVQVLTFFTDCKLQLPENTSTMFDSMDVDVTGAGGGPARLIHMPSLLESPAPGQEVAGGISVALVMEYMDAGCLADAIQNRVFFERLEPQPSANGRPGKSMLAVSMRSVYSTLLEIALALRHMHSLHLVHCDLKPQNVLLKTAPRDPRGFTAKLSDFGLAKTMAHDENGQLVIDEAVGSGTITHIAPEVFMGKKSLGAAVDIYAFGILMFQVLCGMRLYEGMTVQDIANSVAHRMMRPALPSWVPANYRALAERCWHQVPSVRPTADDLVRSLEKLSDFRRNRQQQRPQSGINH